MLKLNLLTYGLFGKPQPKPHEKQHRKFESLSVIARSVEAVREIELEVRVSRYTPYKTKIIHHLHAGDGELI